MNETKGRGCHRSVHRDEEEEEEEAAAAVSLALLVVVMQISPALKERELRRAREKFQRGFCWLDFSFMPIYAGSTL